MQRVHNSTDAMTHVQRISPDTRSEKLEAKEHAARLGQFTFDGPQINYTATCGDGAAKVVTTTYHGDRSDGTDRSGGMTVAKRVGACK